MRKVFKVKLQLRSYIAHPYWPARHQVIEIQKKSGVNRQRSEDKRLAALKAECKTQGISFARYEELLIEAAEQWYRREDRMIYIPRHQIAGAFVETIGGAPKALRGIYTKDNFRAMVQIGDFQTDQTECTAVFGRFVKLEGSNQRSWQENECLGEYLDDGEPFTANGQLAVEDDKQEDTLRALLEAVVTQTGIGAARKMGFGRGQVLSWE